MVQPGLPEKTGSAERRRDLYRLVVAALTVSAAWAFLAVAGWVLGGSSQVYDEALLEFFRSSEDPGLPRGPGWMVEVGRDITALGGIPVLTGLVTVVAGMLVLVRRFTTAALVLGSGFGAVLVNLALKYTFGRERPSLVPHLMEVKTLSFPSGHAMVSAAVYLSLGLLLANTRTSRREKAYILAVATLIPFLVGISRVFLGVHYPTDVLAGWLAGTAMALICGWLARTVELKTAFDPEHEADD